MNEDTRSHLMMEATDKLNGLGGRRRRPKKFWTALPYSARISQWWNLPKCAELQSMALVSTELTKPSLTSKYFAYYMLSGIQHGRDSSCGAAFVAYSHQHQGLR
ncbi:hypothetical protein QQF64_029800 [Cirrhinus molitorella]|uniref:Uncharacterized protein n=1 Tax=Cirrhinus molitorella TaxID=172907 RepID=A0ABR3N1P0_9TELE